MSLFLCLSFFFLSTVWKLLFSYRLTSFVHKHNTKKKLCTRQLFKFRAIYLFFLVFVKLKAAEMCDAHVLKENKNVCRFHLSQNPSLFLDKCTFAPHTHDIKESINKFFSISSCTQVISLSNCERGELNVLMLSTISSNDDDWVKLRVQRRETRYHFISLSTKSLEKKEIRFVCCRLLTRP